MNALVYLFGLSCGVGYLYHNDTLHGLAVGATVGFGISFVLHFIHAVNIALKDENSR